ncbi:unnamed protein product [Lymnaea stagnalis]|uniref:Uncharacterized protein n=1 Tax=Lymnaea stagnalis TaxID=6523 RepID=A0AAV2I3N3_LYMST
MNSSELSEEIVNKQVLVTSVKMQLDFSSIHVYWDCHRSDAGDLETLLLNHANKLRSLLISYHVLGRIPPIIFKKDKTHGDLALIDQLLEIADYGPDYVPSNPHFQVKGYGEISSSTPEVKNYDFAAELSQSLTQMTIDDYGGAQNKQESNSDSDVSNLSAGKPNELPGDSLTPGLIFRSDIYGLPRDKLLKKIVAQRDRVKFQPGDLETEPTSDEEFDSKRLLNQKDKVLLKEKKGFTKMKQKLLEREVDDF